MATRSKSEPQLSPEDLPPFITAHERGLLWIIGGRILQGANVIIFLAVVGPKWLALNQHFDLSSMVTCIILVGIVGVMHAIAMKCVQHGRKLRADTPEEIMRKDLRPPVLYLRPFATDSKMKKLPPIPENYFSYAPRGQQSITRTEEEQMVHVLQTIGPVIALGNPKDPLPELGAARRYLEPGDDWLGLVKEWMAQASVVVLQAGTSENLLTELETARDMLSPEQLLILLSMDDKEYPLFKQKIEDLWSIQFPDYIGRKVYGSMTGCIYFKPGWQPYFLEMKGTPSYRDSPQPLAPILESTLQPFFDQFEQVSTTSSRARQENLRLTQEGATKSQELSREGHITEHYTRAVEQLGNDRGSVRLRAIYALERMARDSERDYWPIMEVLTAYVRENAPWKEEEQRSTEESSPQEPQLPQNKPPLPKLAADIQAILTVIGRRTRTFGKGESERLNLMYTDLQGAHLSHVQLQGAHLAHAQLQGARLWDARLEGARLDYARLEEARLDRAQLQGASLWRAQLEGAINLTVTQLSTVKTLYQAQLDLPLREQIQQRYPHLLEEPQD